MTRPATPEELQLAAELLPCLDPGAFRDAPVLEGGQSHRVLVLAPHAVIRMARTEQASADMPRSVALHNALDGLLPYRVPTQLSGIVDFHGSATVAMRHLPGAAHPPHSGDPVILRRLVTALAQVDPAPLRPLLAPPFSFRGPWTGLRIAQCHDALPGALRAPARALFDRLPQLADVPAGLVHGDLAGHNMHWVDGRLDGILDWDLAAAWDPALNIAYLGLWHGQDLIERIAPDAEQARRARIWIGLLSLERFADAITRTDNPKLGKLLRKIGPRLHDAADACR